LPCVLIAHSKRYATRPHFNYKVRATPSWIETSSQ
jgi:hypothetical protein